MGRKLLPRTTPFEKKCSACHAVKGRGEFNENRRTPTGLQSSCKACTATRTAARQAVYHERWNEKMRRRRVEQPEVHAQHLRARRDHKYHANFEAMWAEQGGKCAICEEDMLPSGNGPEAVAVDHDRSCCPTDKYSCGQCVRGLIHKRCNILLGHCHDDVAILEQAIVYLVAWKGRKRAPAVRKRWKQVRGVRAPQIRVENAKRFRAQSRAWFSERLAS